MRDAIESRHWEVRGVEAIRDLEGAPRFAGLLRCADNGRGDWT
jgi:hypothetical protein